MSESSLNKSRNFFVAKGILSEKCSLVKGTGRTPMQIEHGYKYEIYENGVKTGKFDTCDRLFGMVTIETQDGLMDFQINAKSKTSTGEENKRWKMFETIANEWNPKIGGSGEPDFVTLSGSVAIYDQLGKDGKVYPKLQWSATSKCDRIAYDWDNSGCTLTASAYIKAVAPEIIKEEETGRYKVSAFGVDGRGQVFPIDFCVAGDDAVDFITDDVNNGDTISFDANRVVKMVGGSNKSNKKSFGSSRVDTNSGFSVDELILTAAEIIEEPDELTIEDEDGNEVPIKTLWLNPVAVKKAIKEREKMLEELKNNGSNTSNTKSSSGSIKDRAKEKAAMKKPAHPVEEDDDDAPFDIDDDDDF